MARRYVDLSMTLENDIVSDPPFLKPTITYEVHADTRHELETFFPGADIDGLHGGEPFCASEWVKLTTHSGTHVALTHTLAKLFARATAHSDCMAAVVASGLRSVWSIIAATTDAAMAWGAAGAMAPPAASTRRIAASIFASSSVAIMPPAQALPS